MKYVDLWSFGAYKLISVDLIKEFVLFLVLVNLFISIVFFSIEIVLCVYITVRVTYRYFFTALALDQVSHTSRQLQEM